MWNSLHTLILCGPGFFHWGFNHGGPQGAGAPTVEAESSNVLLSQPWAETLPHLLSLGERLSHATAAWSTLSSTQKGMLRDLNWPQVCTGVFSFFTCYAWPEQLSKKAPTQKRRECWQSAAELMTRLLQLTQYDLWQRGCLTEVHRAVLVQVRESFDLQQGVVIRALRDLMNTIQQ